MRKPPKSPNDSSTLRRRAEVRLNGQWKGQWSKVDTGRVLHELEVHQIELEMQNSESLKTRNELEAALEKYTDLYDFAPVGYLSIDESGAVLEVNLTGAALLGVERSRLINRRLLSFVSATSRPVVLAFLRKIFTRSKDQSCDAVLLKTDGGTFWVNFRATSAVDPKGSRKWCRVAFGDITVRKQAEEAQRRLDVMADTNRGLNREIARRQAVEESLRKSERHYSELLEQSRLMQDQLRYLSHQILSAQEEERKRISRELHDEIAQTLTSINVRLAALKVETMFSTKGLQKKISHTQRMVVKSVDIVHRFARELRPTVLDDLGLIPALHSFVKIFSKRTGLHVRLTAYAAVEQLDSGKRTVLYRVAQEALTNVARHAHANRVDVSIHKLPTAVGLTVKDNGKSFQVNRVLHAKRNKSLGLLGMRERVEMVGGSLRIESAPGEGTTILAEIPHTNGRAKH